MERVAQAVQQVQPPRPVHLLQVQQVQQVPQVNHPQQNKQPQRRSRNVLQNFTGKVQKLQNYCTKQVLGWHNFELTLETMPLLIQL